MQYLLEKRFTKRTLITVLAAGIAVQIIRFIINFVLQYSVIGNVSLSALEMPLNVAWEFLGVTASCVCTAAAVYLTFIYGIRGGGEWILALFTLYGLVYFLTFYIGSINFGLAATGVAVTVLAAAFIGWSKFPKKISLTIFISMLIPYLGAVIIMFATTVIDYDSFAYNMTYGLLNLGTDFLVINLAVRIAGFLRSVKIKKGGGSADISLRGKYFSFKNPIITAYMISDVIFSLPSLITAIGYSAEETGEYGWPVNTREWLAFFAPYITVVIYLVVGYLAMVITANILESAFLTSEDEADTVEKYTKRRLTGK